MQWLRSCRNGSALAVLLAGSALILPHSAAAQDGTEIIHDAEFYVLQAQNGDRWTEEDEGLQAKLAELEERFGTKPNLIHIMWDDTAYGDLGIPAIQAVRGLNTPNINKLAEDGMMFTRMHPEPSRGRHWPDGNPVRHVQHWHAAGKPRSARR
jgi:hypothetical protein